MNKLKILKKINHAAKYLGKLKQQSYDNGQYSDVAIYKKVQRGLYLLKSLVLLDMCKKRELLLSTPVSDSFGINLCSFVDINNRYCFHSISANQEDEYPVINLAVDLGDKPIYYLPYMRYLINSLDSTSKEIFNRIYSEGFKLSPTDKTRDLFDFLYKNGVKAEIEEGWYWGDFGGYKYRCALYKGGILLCTITIQFATSDYDLFSQKGELIIDESDEWELYQEDQEEN